jgi:hypothetical protein
MKKNLDHLVIDMVTGCLECEHCHVRYDLALPQPINMVVAVAATFTHIHRNCAKVKPSELQTL